MVITKSELISSLQHEVNILLHLASKIDRAKLDYRPTPKQRSTLELLQYLSIMGPGLVKVAQAGKFDPAAWTALEKSAETHTFEQTVAAIAAQKDTYAQLARRYFGRRPPRRNRTVRPNDLARRFYRQPGAVRVRCVSHAAVLLFESVRTRRTVHDQPLGRCGRAGGGLARERAGACSTHTRCRDDCAAAGWLQCTRAQPT